MNPVKWLTMIVAMAACAMAALAQTCPNPNPGGGPVKGKISRNFYRPPYENGMTISCNDYFGHNGSMDMDSHPQGAVMVAPADGVICFVRDHLNDCGCADASHPIGACGNRIALMHANGEWSDYLHVKQFSVRDTFGVSDPNDLIGVFVSQGDPIAIEGDVGRTCAGNPPGPDDSDPRWGTCITEQQAAGLGPCGSHSHWNIRRVTTGELLQPMTCNILIYQPGVNYTLQPCNAIVNCPIFASHYSNVTWNGYGNAHVYQNSDSITADTFVVQNQASVVFHAANRVKLLPGFRAGTGDAYFRAEIGQCSVTAPNP